MALATIVVPSVVRAVLDAERRGQHSEHHREKYARARAVLDQELCDLMSFKFVYCDHTTLRVWYDQRRSSLASDLYEALGQPPPPPHRETNVCGDIVRDQHQKQWWSASASQSSSPCDVSSWAILDDDVSESTNSSYHCTIIDDVCVLMDGDDVVMTDVFTVYDD